MLDVQSCDKVLEAKAVSLQAMKALGGEEI
jgi:hypothetical protein